MMRALALPNGRVSGRGLVILLLAALCVAGIVRIAAGAIVPAKAVVAQILLERAFDRSVERHQPQKPWGWADMAPVARIRVARLGVDRIVLDSGSGQAMAFGPTLLPGGAALGQPGVTVIAAHRDTHFRFLKHVRAGDIIEVEGIDGRDHRYRVQAGEVVRWDRFAVSQDLAENELALSTCYPFDAVRHGPLRYVVHATPIA
ncbi:class GN sortase [Nostoc sp. 3335mG]|nr:class GN sortase [Nostoc sp. 3335mG]